MLKRNRWLPAALLVGASAILLGCGQPGTLTRASSAFPDRIAAPEIAPVAYPYSTRARMMRVLETEWREWGSTVFDQRLAPLPATARGSLNEYDRNAFSKVLAYWAVLPDKAGYIDLNRQMANTRAFGPGTGVPMTDAERYCAGGYGGDDSDPWIWGCQPWSAAFISYVMLNAGISEAEFPRHAAHREYIDALIRIAERYPNQAAFIPREIGNYTPQAGDLICADRSHGSRINTFTERREELRQGDAPNRPMHCDIVIESGIRRGEILAVGGNVGQTVAASRFSLDASNHLQRTGRNFFVVFENRIGRDDPTM